MIGLIGIALSLGLLILMAYRGYSVIALAPIAALVSVVFAGLPLLASYTQVFMPALAGFIASYFPLFLSGAVFGKLMSVTGYAEVVAYGISRLIGSHRAVFATVLAGAVLTYGGVSVFVVAFALFPIARALFKQADVPKRLIPATIGLGAFTFTMSALPGTPQIQNVIPTTFFDTNTYAAPVLGLIASVIMLVGGMVWLTYRTRALHRRGEGFSDSDTAPGHVDDGPQAGRSDLTVGRLPRTMPNFALALVPVVLVAGVNYALTAIVFPRMDFGYLSDERYGGVTINQVSGTWSVFVALLVAILFIIVVNPGYVRALMHHVGEGAKSAVVPIFSTASEVGYGAVIASVPAFLIVRDSIMGVSENPVVSTAVSTTVLAGITASASGGMSIALGALGADLKAAAIADDVSLELMHRVTSVASGGLDTLPHSGALITLLLICGLTHRQAYKDIAVITIVMPLIAVTAIIILGILFGSF